MALSAIIRGDPEVLFQKEDNIPTHSYIEQVKIHICVSIFL